MLRYIVTAMLLCPFTVSAGTHIINLESGPYWQVQDSASYRTICEGFLHECHVPNGSYTVINLTTGHRSETTLPDPDTFVPTPKLVLAHKNCQYLNNADVVVCQVHCPVGKVAVSMAHCSSYIPDQEAYLKTQENKYFYQVNTRNVPMLWTLGDTYANCQEADPYPNKDEIKDLHIDVAIKCM